MIKDGIFLTIAILIIANVTMCINDSNTNLESNSALRYDGTYNNGCYEVQYMNDVGEVISQKEFHEKYCKLK